MRTIKIDTVIAALIVVNLLLGIYLSYSYSVGSPEGLCLVKAGNALSCADVQNSTYGTYFGFKLAHWGLAAFTILLMLFLYLKFSKNKKTARILFLASTSIGALIALYFISIQLFVLKAICSTCMTIDTSTIIIFVLTYAEYIYRRKQPFEFHN